MFNDIDASSFRIARPWEYWAGAHLVQNSRKGKSEILSESKRAELICVRIYPAPFHSKRYGQLVYRQKSARAFFLVYALKHGKRLLICARRANRGREFKCPLTGQRLESSCRPMRRCYVA